MKSYQDYDEALFEGRNKEYGAYITRRNYWRNYYTAWVISGTILLLFLVFLLLSPVIWPTSHWLDGMEVREVIVTDTGQIQLFRLN